MAAKLLFALAVTLIFVSGCDMGYRHGYKAAIQGGCR